MMVAMLQLNGQLRTEGDGETEKRCQTPSPYRRLLMMVWKQLKMQMYEVNRSVTVHDALQGLGQPWTTDE